MARNFVVPWSGSAAASANVVVIGSGAGGATAVLSAKWAGADHVMLLETDPKVFGGTTAKSGGPFGSLTIRCCMSEGGEMRRNPHCGSWPTILIPKNTMRKIQSSA